jgi:hypothetical protein
LGRIGAAAILVCCKHQFPSLVVNASSIAIMHDRVSRENQHPKPPAELLNAAFRQDSQQDNKSMLEAVRKTLRFLFQCIRATLAGVERCGILSYVF